MLLFLLFEPEISRSLAFSSSVVRGSRKWRIHGSVASGHGPSKRHPNPTQISLRPVTVGETFVSRSPVKSWTMATFSVVESLNGLLTFETNEKDRCTGSDPSSGSWICEFISKFRGNRMMRSGRWRDNDKRKRTGTFVYSFLSAILGGICRFT
jgi:hypothetical protein